MTREKFGICPLCQRTIDLTFHHLIPKKIRRRTHYRKNYTSAFLNQGIDICRKCHSGIHRTYDEMYLAKQLNTLDAIREDETLKRHFAWVAKQRRQTGNADQNEHKED